MSIGSESGSSAKESLSALTDGELDSAEVLRACAAWRDDAQTRRTWHAYQLIGDVLRSEDLASTSRRDADFLAALRGRLAEEPVVLAPEPVAEAMAEPAVAAKVANSRWSWMAPSAVAAGFVLVTGALLVTRTPGPMGGASDSMFARLGLGSTPSVQVVNVSTPTLAASSEGASSAEPQAIVLTGKMLRDARVDLYMSAHKQFAGSTALGVPSGFLRNAAAEVPAR
ncbi:sigma-E factor negative regulatory protein [Piscinibacter terrae]|uniref:Anti-sigma 24 factor n=1 Tax=Piscinibacter terrae TaxID=2496871 RepID=A0A3N7HKW1_9BURK|nr:sigma-E factor negative regulatory protein [Albitalea terrae]RQP21646.1 anti-sigma 24 factor [Albitalea terrae]